MRAYNSLPPRLTATAGGEPLFSAATNGGYMRGIGRGIQARERRADPRAIAAGGVVTAAATAAATLGPWNLGIAAFAGAIVGGLVTGAISRTLEREFIDGAIAVVLGGCLVVAAGAAVALAGGADTGETIELGIFAVGGAFAAGLLTFPVGLLSALLSATLLRWL